MNAKSKVKSKNVNAVALGSLGGPIERVNAEQKSEIAKQGGLAGGTARADRTIESSLQRVAKKAAEARWNKEKNAASSLD